METLIFIVIAAVITVIQKKLEKAREQRQSFPPPQPREKTPEDPESQESPQEHEPPRSLQDLIRQFEEAQQQASQGNIEPPTPPATGRSPDEPLTLRDIAEAVIEVDYIDLEFLMDTFGVDENTAAEMLMDLQAHRIVGHDMGEGTCDVLVHDIDELENLLNHANRAEESLRQDVDETDEAEREDSDAYRQESERERELRELEERAKAARENAAAISGADFAPPEPAVDSASAAPRHRPLVSARDRDSVRKGFIWAKVLDEPRFKRRWSAQYR